MFRSENYFLTERTYNYAHSDLSCINIKLNYITHTVKVRENMSYKNQQILLAFFISKFPLRKTYHWLQNQTQLRPPSDKHIRFLLHNRKR